MVLFSHSPGRPGTSCLCSVELRAQVCTTMPSCLSQVVQVHSLGCPGARMSNINPWGLHKHQGKKGKQWPLQPLCFTEAIACFLMHADSFSIMYFPGVELFLFSLLLCRKPKKSTTGRGSWLCPKSKSVHGSFYRSSTCSMH